MDYCMKGRNLVGGEGTGFSCFPWEGWIKGCKNVIKITANDVLQNI
jgi:hypothetical protein